ncbi:protocadherin gamma-B1-like [Bufo gargarizans]|uniref:protocadherin gamma-B1-like n=1 Tax=Bufo gargarizans TaxID=30331 RepID=UPI001CF48971|nr:protocadherin gamma-B1-like [Bufo gargarizans]
MQFHNFTSERRYLTNKKNNTKQDPLGFSCITDLQTQTQPFSGYPLQQSIIIVAYIFRILYTLLKQNFYKFWILQKLKEMTLYSQTNHGLKWQVTIFILFSWLHQSGFGQIHYSITEEMRKDSVIANITDDLGFDIKQLSSRKLRIVSRASEKYFFISLDNGSLCIKERIDRETLCGAEYSCYLTFDIVIENPFHIFKIKVEILDINDNSPTFFHETFSVEIIESALPGTRFALQSAEDPDTGMNSVQTYKLSDNQYFILSEKVRPDGSKFPELVLDKPLDREAEHIHILTLIAIDGGDPMRSGTALISIIVTDANDNFPIFGKEIYRVSIQEDIPMNTIIVNVNATDKDEGINAQITYSFSKTSDNIHHTGMFIINSINGDIKTNRNVDFEVTRNYELSVQAKDGGGLISHCKILIEVIDMNDNVPQIVISSLLSPIQEDAKPGTMIALIEVHDQDTGFNGETDCEIVEIVPFNLQLSSDNYYTLSTSMTLDREQQAYYNITIEATDRGSPPLSNRRTIGLEIADVNDNPPVFITSKYSAYIPENNLPRASIFSIKAIDPDIGHNAKIIYTISTKDTENLSMSSFFSMNIETGVLYAQRSFDYEQNKSFEIQVNAKDNGSPPLDSNATLVINIVDQNDNSPNILYPSTENGWPGGYEMVSIMAEPRSLITKVVAVDPDSGHNSWLSYHFIHVTEPSYFIIGEHTGEIRTTRAFQEKDTLKQKVVVMVKDNGEPSLSATVTINVFLTNNIQVAPKLTNQIENEDTQSNLHLYLVIALALISLLFIFTVMIVIISKCKESKSLETTFGAVSTNLYPQIDSRMLSLYSDGSLPFPYSYNVCVALDSTENDFAFVKPQQNVPVDNLLDANDSGLGDESLKEASPTTEQKSHKVPFCAKMDSWWLGQEEIRKDSVIANIADDLGLDIKQLSSRKLRIVSRASDRYFNVSLDTGNLYIKERIDRETLFGAEASCFFTFDAVVEII